jgi:putative transcriptional regulator
MKCLAGKLLVASPQLEDPNFFQTVVLMVQHESQGAFGVVLNRPSEKSLNEVWEMIGKNPCGIDQLVHIGGPVPGPLLALHTVEKQSDQEILPGLHVTGQESAFEALIQNPTAKYRFFSGHAGWGSGQLEGELKVGGWLQSDATIDDVFSDFETLWDQVTSRIGLQIIAPGIRPDQIPKDPGLN